jgi:DNA mismatch endonuclease (patch repair protein)
MARVHSTGTSPEMKVRRAIHRAGFRFRLHRADLPGKPDLVFPRFRLVVFVHGCFWHWHGCKRSRMPATNRDYWTRKIARNVERDQRNQQRLIDLDWEVRIIWECELAAGIDAAIAELRNRHASFQAANTGN